VPVLPEADWETAKAFTKRLAEAMTADSPRLYVAKSTKSARRGKIFIDYLRNGRGSTAVAAYSTRAKPKASVSVPLDWPELSDALRADHFTIDNVRQRLDHLSRDPWAGFFKLRQRLPKL
jgi:bifunctional non-homologous end joining protein LigD